MKRSTFILCALPLIVLPLLSPLSAEAAAHGSKTIVEVDAHQPKNSSNIYLINNVITFAVSWTQTLGHSNVAVSAYLTAQLVRSYGTGYGTACLTTHIGPDTQPSNVLARADFEFTPTPFNDVPIRLFEGLNLPPGTYYLIVASDETQPNLGWEVDFDSKVTSSRDAEFDSIWAALGEAENVGDVTTRNLTQLYDGRPLFRFVVTSER